MKKVVLNYLVMAALAVAAVCMSSCGGGSGSGGGKSSAKIKMTTESSYFSFFLGGSGVATVDWGDGSEKVSLTLNERGVLFTHTYSNATIRTIAINGDNITSLNCEFSTSLDVSRCTELTKLECIGPFASLDVSKNTALTYLQCTGLLTRLDVSRNTALTHLICVSDQLTSLDMSKNTVLAFLSCSGQLSSSALNALFGTLHSNNTTYIVDMDKVAPKHIRISSNPGAADCDRSIAERKGWTVR